MIRLLRKARDVAGEYGLFGIPRSHEDLLSEAFLRLLSGDRSWRKGVDFEYQLTQVMRSIADNWRRIDAKAGGFEVRESNLRVAVVDNEDDDPIDPGRQGLGFAVTLALQDDAIRAVA